MSTEAWNCGTVPRSSAEDKLRLTMPKAKPATWTRKQRERDRAAEQGQTRDRLILTAARAGAHGERTRGMSFQAAAAGVDRNSDRNCGTLPRP